MAEDLIANEQLISPAEEYLQVRGPAVQGWESDSAVPLAASPLADFATPSQKIKPLKKLKKGQIWIKYLQKTIKQSITDSRRISIMSEF